MQDYEKLGVFYLGREYDLAANKPKEDLVLYDSKDLTTHALCVGMTGSGKTGLCLALLEEAAIDGIPAIIIDPKGDLGNLLLTFPQLAAGRLCSLHRPGGGDTSGQISRGVREKRLLRSGSRGSPIGANSRNASPASAKPPMSPSTPPAAMPACRSRSCAPSLPRRNQLATMPKPSANPSPPPPPACSASSASKPTPSAAANRF